MRVSVHARYSDVHTIAVLEKHNDGHRIEASSKTGRKHVYHNNPFLSASPCLVKEFSRYTERYIAYGLKLIHNIKSICQLVC